MDGYTVISEPTITVVNGNFYTVDQNVYNFYDPEFTYPAGSYIEYKGKLYQYKTESTGVEPTSATLVEPFDNVNVNASIDDVKEILAGEGGVDGSFLTQSVADAKYATIATVNTKLDTATYTADKATFALKSEIPDVSGFATTEQVNAKLDTTVYEADKETFALKSELPDISGKLDTATYTSDKETFATVSQLGEKLDTTVYEADKATFALKSELPNCVRINIRDTKLTTEVHSKEDILGWFKCTTEAELKKKILSEVPMFLLYGISLTGKPMYYRMPIEYIAFESATQIKMVFSGLNTRVDVVSKYVIVMNLDGTVIGDSTSNVSMTITSLENTSKVTELETKITELEKRLEALEGTSETV